jgi:hypothetical protein
MAADASRRPVPGDGLLHPIVLVSLGLLIANDQVLKGLWPGPVTGKLSDIAGLIVAPIALLAAWEIGSHAVGRPWGPSRTAVLSAIVLAGLAFAAIQVWEPASEAFRVGLGVLQWPFRALGAWAAGGTIGAPVPVAAVADAEDLLALPALAAAWWAGRSRLRGGGRPVEGP